MPATLSPILKQATPVQVATGRGAVLTDIHGREYLDFTAGIGVTSTGHCHPKVVAAAQEQVARLIHGQYTTVMHPGHAGPVGGRGQLHPPPGRPPRPRGAPARRGAAGRDPPLPRPAAGPPGRAGQRRPAA
jgi:hypothetical protein